MLLAACTEKVYSASKRPKQIRGKKKRLDKISEGKSEETERMNRTIVKYCAWYPFEFCTH